MVNFYGREKLYTDFEEITSENITNVLSQIEAKHGKNKNQIQFLYDYYRGKQPILDRKKEIRPEICHKVVENWANAIVSFKVGYLCGSPIQYVSGKSEEDLTDKVDTLNDFMDSIGKAGVDKDLFEWQMICGTSYRATFSDEEEVVKISSLDPRKTFVIYSNDIFEKPLAGCYVSVKKEGGSIIKYTTVYTEKEIIVVKEGSVISKEPNTLNKIPIIEYPANNSRLSVIEVVLDLLNAINDLDSGRLDSVEQFVQSLMVVYNAKLEDETGNSIREKGLVELKSVGDAKADIKIISEQLDQSQTQTLKNDLIQRVREIIGLPSQGDGSTGDSSNNGAMILKGGWENAETRARESELMFKKSELPFMKFIFEILRKKNVVDLEVSDVDIRFTRRNYENIQVKSQVLTTMLSNEKIAPKLAFESCGMFIDPEEAYKESKDYYDSRRVEQPNIPNDGGNNELPKEEGDRFNP